MRLDQRHRRGRLVELAALDADGAVLDHVDPPDPVRRRRLLVQSRDQARRARAPRRRARPAARARSRSRRRSARGAAAGEARQHEGLLGRRGPRILEDAGLDRAAEEVVVDRVRRLGVRLDRDAARAAYAISSSRVQMRSRSGAITRHARVARLERELEAKLVVALAGAAVDDGLGAELERDPGDRLGDDGARERGDERVLALVERVRDAAPSRPARRRTRPLRSRRITSSAPAPRPRRIAGSKSASCPTSTSTATTSSKP